MFWKCDSLPEFLDVQAGNRGRVCVMWADKTLPFLYLLGS